MGPAVCAEVQDEHYVINVSGALLRLCEPVWPSGKHGDICSNSLRLSFLFKSAGVILVVTV